jgi:hypothetical protein
VFKNFPISKFVYDSPLYDLAMSQTSNLNNSANLNQKFENIFLGLSGPQMELFYEKKTQVKNLVFCPFKESGF